MGHNQDIHTKCEPKALEESQVMYDKFIIWSRNISVVAAIILALMAFFLV